MTMVYKWARQPAGDVSAQVAGEELERIRVKNNGNLTPRAVLEESRDEAAPLHPAFEWDDAVAAEKHREDQARYLIRSITVVAPERGVERPTRAFVSVSVEEEPVYDHVVTAMSDADKRQQVLRRALAELEGWQRKYADLEELAGVFAAIEAAKAA